MKSPKLYIDTSVIGGCRDDEFSEYSLHLFNEIRQGKFIPVVSDVIAEEILGAPETEQLLFAELLNLGAEQIILTKEVVQVAKTYEDRGILGPKHKNDMLHIALATVASVDILVSWNFKHIVRYDKIRMFNAVSLELGYRALEIYSPRELVSYEED